jgi:hypothetical protein
MEDKGKMEAILVLVVGVILFDLAALRWGTDSRGSINDIDRQVLQALGSR